MKTAPLSRQAAFAAGGGTWIGRVSAGALPGARERVVAASRREDVPRARRVERAVMTAKLTADNFRLTAHR